MSNTQMVIYNKVDNKIFILTSEAIKKTKVLDSVYAKAFSLTNRKLKYIGLTRYGIIKSNATFPLYGMYEFTPAADADLTTEINSMLETLTATTRCSNVIELNDIDSLDTFILNPSGNKTNNQPHVKSELEISGEKPRLMKEKEKPKMPTKTINPNSTTITEDLARQTIADGLHEAAKIVGSTMGPDGKLAIVAAGEAVTSTKDGHSVLNDLQLDNPWHQFAVKLLVDATKHSVQASGDGTTTTTVLTYAMVEWGLKQLESGVKLKRVVQQLKDDVAQLISYIEETKTNVTTRDDLYNIAYISTNGDDEMANIIADAWWTVQRNGVVQYREGISTSDELKTVGGYRIERGFYEKAFVPNTVTLNLESPKVFLFSKEVSTDMLEAMTSSCQDHQPIVLVAPDFTDEVVSLLLKINHKLSVTPVKADSAGAMQQNLLSDMAAYLGTKVVHSPEALSDVGYYAVPAKVSVSPLDAVFIINRDEEVDDLDVYLDSLKTARDGATDGYDYEAYTMRIAKLEGGVATIFVAGNTDAEMAERKARYDDAVKATRAAFLHGYSIGGGYNYLQFNGASWKYAPICQLCKNSDLDPERVLKTYFEQGQCFNIADEQYVPKDQYMPTDATVTQTTALKTAMSIALITLRTNSVLTTQATLMPYSRRIPV